VIPEKIALLTAGLIATGAVIYSVSRKAKAKLQDFGVRYD